MFVLAGVVGVKYGITDAWEVSVDLPFVRKELKPEGAEDPDGEHDEETSAHAEETLSGPGDLRLSVRRHCAWGGRYSASLAVGLSMPTGDTRPVDRLSFLDAEEAEMLGIEREAVPELQNGTGAWFPLVSVMGGMALSSTVTSYASATLDLHFQENDSGWRRAPAFSGETGIQWRPAGEDYRLRLALHFFTAGGDTFRGDDVKLAGGLLLEGDIPDLRNGRSELSVRPGILWVVDESLTLHADLSTPIWSKLQSGDRAQENVLRERAGLFIGVSWHP